MFLCVIHNIPHGKNREKKDRNIKTMMYASGCYLLLYIFINSNYSANFSKIKYLKKYFIWILLADIASFILSCTLYDFHRHWRNYWSCSKFQLA